MPNDQLIPYYDPKDNTVFVACADDEETARVFGDNVYKERIFRYLGGFGLVYNYDPKVRNCNMPLTHDEFNSLPL